MWSIQELVDFPVLLMLIAANGTPVIAARLFGSRYSAPIDANRSFQDGRPLFGAHKTWRGLLAGSVAAGVVGLMLGTGFAIGALFGALALTGDLLSSFIKRRLAWDSGKSLLFLDQLPEALLPMLMLHSTLEMETGALIGTALAFTALDVATARFRRDLNSEPRPDRNP